ncbi:MAG: phBC6A51 family helix-turn-helix protein [Patescibacteria group bacterium]
MTEEAKNKLKQQLLERLTKNFTIRSACHAVGVDRKTFYRWAEEDNDFKKLAYENMQEAKKDITDIANAQLVNHINQGNLKAVIYWLNHKDPEITDKASAMTEEEIKALSALLYNDDTFKKGQELLMSYVLQGKIGEGTAQLILRLFMAQMRVEDIKIRKTEAEVMSEVLLRDSLNKSQKK